MGQNHMSHKLVRDSKFGVLLIRKNQLLTYYINNDHHWLLIDIIKNDVVEEPKICVF